jgi:predicted AAA+ superfamily ATPase
MIGRDLAPHLTAAAKAFPAVTLTGPRQSGKSTLCQAIFPRHAYVSLEATDVRRFAQQDPRAFLGQFPQGAIIDEIQRAPELPSYLQEFIDRDPFPGRWIVTGSQNLAVIETVSQSLAGRTAILHLLPLSHGEVLRFRKHPHSLEETLFAGGYPRIFDRGLAPSAWLSAYVATYVERDVRSVLKVGDLMTFQRFVELCAGRTAQLLNLSNLADDSGISQPTAKAWLSVLEATFIVFRLPVFSRGVRKRLVKMPKLHFCDTGLACWLLGIRSPDQLRAHPLRGALFETWVASEIMKHRIHHGESGGLFYYRDRHGTEADAVVVRGEGLSVVEAKAGATVSDEMVGAFRRVRDGLALSTPTDSCLVYGGEMPQKRSDLTVLPWTAVHKHRWL